MSPIDISKFEQLKATGELPSPKGVALAIIRMTQQESVSTAEIARVVKSDPAFVGRLIKASNGINAVGRRPVASVQDALLVLGIPAVRTLALGFSLLSTYRNGSCRNFDYQEYWSGSLACAIAMQAIATRARIAQPEEAFCVGLLARIGELALATLFPEDYSRILAHVVGHRGSRLVELERESFAMDHRELSTAMLSDWGVPKIFVEPVYFHEEPEQAGFPDGSRHQNLMQALVLARHVATVCVSPEKERHALMPHLFLLGSRLSIDAEDLSALCDGVAKEWLDWGALLSVRTQCLPAFEEMANPLPEPAPLAPSVAAPTVGGQRLRVLVVDDDPTMRAMLRSVLEKAGHEVAEAKNGTQGMEVALDTQPQMMIVDWMMPEMDGIEMIKALRKTKVGRHIYVLILTSLEEEDRLVEAFASGVDDFMSKPLKPRVLAARLQAGGRVIKLQEEIQRDREEIRQFAAELAISNRRLQEMALTDVLTGFPNRRYAMDRMQQEWASSSRHQRALACMVIDLDEFKQINDSFGHDVGDTVLRQTTAVVKQAIRAQDVICRLGGDEFLVICPETSLEQGLVCAERVRRAVEAMQVRTGMLALKGSVSIGVAARDAAMADAEALIKRADQSAYLAKDRGRNCVAAAQVSP